MSANASSVNIISSSLVQLSIQSELEPSCTEKKINGAQGVLCLLQSYWKKNFKTRDDIRNEQHKLLWSKANPVLKEVIAYKDGDDVEVMFNKMVSLCIHLSGLGSSSSQPVVKETYPALNSVLKVSDLASFAELPHGERQQHMLELAQIVMGIRLFNKDCLKGGVGIEDLPDVVTRALVTSQQRILQIEVEATKNCEHLSNFLSSLYDLSGRVMDIPLESLPSVGLSNDDLVDLQAMLCLSWQCIYFVRDLRKQILATKLHVTSVLEQLRTTLVQLHETVRYRSAIPTIQVYPLFIQMSIVWRELQYETGTLGHFNKLLETLQKVVKEIQQPPTEQNNLKKGKKSPINKELISGRSSTPEDPSAVKLRGFCPWTLVQTGGFLLQGHFKDAGYSFRSPEAATAWCRNKGKSEAALEFILRRCSYLQYFLGTMLVSEEDDVYSLENESAKVIRRDAEVQTELHPVPCNIDPQYCWNEWDLKKRALRVTQLTNMATHSQQTTTSFFRSENGTQTITKLNKSC